MYINKYWYLYYIIVTNMSDNGDDDEIQTIKIYCRLKPQKNIETSFNVYLLIHNLR